MLPFKKEEYLERVRRTKERMQSQGVEVLFATDPANMAYLTGYDGWSFYVHQLVAVSLNDDEPVWIGRPMDANGARVTTYLKNDDIFGYPDHYVQSTVHHPMDFVADIARKRGWDNKTIGVEMDAYYFTAACIDSLRKNLPNARFKDATSLANWVRVVKSKAEIRYMQQAARIMENMIKVTVAAMKPGARQCDVAAKILHAQTAGTKQYGGEYASIVPMLPTGKASTAPHLTWSDRKFRRGELTAIELAAVRNRYHVPLARSVFLGKAPARVLDLAKVQIEGLDAAIGAAKPGVTAEDVERAFRKVITRHGIEKESRIGYSTGLNYPPDWGEHTISLRAGDKTVLQENMTIHCVPALSVGNDGIETSETIQITAKGAKPFCNVPRKLFVKG